MVMWSNVAIEHYPYYLGFVLDEKLGMFIGHELSLLALGISE